MFLEEEEGRMSDVECLRAPSSLQEGSCIKKFVPNIAARIVL
jgi:hypothetical protein